jgi:hypothetical protein
MFGLPGAGHNISNQLSKANKTPKTRDSFFKFGVYLLWTLRTLQQKRMEFEDAEEQASWACFESARSHAQHRPDTALTTVNKKYPGN